MTEQEYQKIIDITPEEWRRVVYRHNLLNYEVSNLGKIRKYDTKKVLKPSYNTEVKNSYKFISIRINDEKTTNTSIHRLMAMMFIPIPEKYLREGLDERTLYIDHKDAVKYHNVLSNLEWVTPAENHERAIDMGLITERTKPDVVREICQSLSDGNTVSQVAKKFNVSEYLVHNIRYRLRWRNISKDYVFPTLRLSESEVRLIAEYISKGYSNPEISKLTEFSESSIEHIRLRDSWTEITKDYTFPKKRLTDEDVIAICKLIQAGKSVREIANQFNVYKTVIEKIRSGKLHKDITKDFKFEYSRFKTPDIVIHKICADIVEGNKTMKQIASDNNVSLTFVKDIKYGRSRTDISKNYIEGLSK